MKPKNKRTREIDAGESSRAPSKKKVKANEEPLQEPIIVNGEDVKEKKKVPKAVASRRKRPVKAPKKVPEGPVHHVSHGKVPGAVLSLGTGDTGQLGLGEDVMEKTKPSAVTLPAMAVQLSAGGMHSACVTEGREVYTWGCNDDGALGRETAEEEECFVPGLLTLPDKIVQVSTGDSHTACLTAGGQLYVTGTFRDDRGVLGLTADLSQSQTPVQILKKEFVCKIASGTDHLLALTVDGDIFSVGNAQQGQLGRIAACFADRGGRKGTSILLSPSQVHCQDRKIKFSDVWTGAYTSYAKSTDDKIWAWGLNNFKQLGLDDMKNRFTPTHLTNFDGKTWQQISGGQHHAVALDSNGQVYTFGRREYGRLGLGADAQDTAVPTPVPSLVNKRCISVNSGSCVSFAASEEGIVYAWGMGNLSQLGQSDDDDLWEPAPMEGKQLKEKKGLAISSGGQHTLVLAKPSN